ncbi:porin family protein [Salinibacter altiplanensis]|uniref:porin family protein n=1 Tax=Salinibacter altiplanensis TaxID=1803181 RepID=UPI000C9F1B36|nr:porin family protein [Salinibacter altiplanensis]
MPFFPSVRPPPQTHSTVLLVGACLLLIGSTAPYAVAQDARVGVRTGPTFGFLSDGPRLFSGGQRSTNANPRIDLHAGAFLLLPFTDAYALQPELLYVRKGGHFSQPLSERYSVERYRLSYVQGLLLGRRALPIRGRLSAHVVAGLSLDFALRGTVQRDARSAQGTFEDHIDLVGHDHLRRWDVGLVAGAGLGYGIGDTGRLSLELRYNPGLRSVFDSSQNALGPSTSAGAFPLASSPSTLRHDVVTASVTYTVPLQLF